LDFRLLHHGRQLADEIILNSVGKRVSNALEIFALEVDREQNSPFTRVNNVRILKRNVDECAKCAKERLNHKERTRFNEPETDTMTQPTTAYMAELLIDLGTSFSNISKNLDEMTTLLRSQTQTVNRPVEYEESRRLLQNNMDCIRYAHPMLTNLAKLKIPVNRLSEPLQTLP